MNDFLTQLLIPTVLGMVIGEFTEVSPWLARRILRLAARRLGSAEATERYEAEWVALLNERPGKLLKLFCASWIALRATWTLRAIHRPLASAPGASNRQAEVAPTPEEQQARSATASESVTPHQRRFFPSARQRRAPQGYVYRRGHLRRSRRRNSPVLAGAMVWISVIAFQSKGVVDFAAIGVLPPCLALPAWSYSERTMNRVRSRLAAASLRKADWSLGTFRLPAGAVRPIREALARGDEVRITDTKRGGDATVRVVDVIGGGLAFVVRPKRHSQR
ncbi:hypothetical protein ABZW10_13310 [Kitasatospora sp. NPDC004723]|uniref:hypothetical protein n=1 Tax=Kitasatospora sp. NPDC004723 TaxID=3154288 RepID=UPI0033A7BB89